MSKKWSEKVVPRSFIKEHSFPIGLYCILKTGGAIVCQKLGMILENKVVQKLKLEKMFFFAKNGLLN